MSDEPVDPWANLISTLEATKRDLQALESPLARRIRSGQHDDIADMLGVAPQELNDAFEDEQPEVMSTLLRKLKTGV